MLRLINPGSRTLLVLMIVILTDFGTSVTAHLQEVLGSLAGFVTTHRMEELLPLMGLDYSMAEILVMVVVESVQTKPMLSGCLTRLALEVRATTSATGPAHSVSSSVAGPRIAWLTPSPIARRILHAAHSGPPLCRTRGRFPVDQRTLPPVLPSLRTALRIVVVLYCPLLSRGILLLQTERLNCKKVDVRGLLKECDVPLGAQPSQSSQSPPFAYSFRLVAAQE